METVGPIDVSPFESSVPAHASTAPTTACARARRSPTCCSASTTRAATCRRPGTSTTRSCRRSTDYSIRPSATSNGRTYQYFTGQTRYPFGYGLSYTTFKYSGLQLSGHALTADDTLNATVTVTNTGTTAGSNTVQLYVNQPNAPASAAASDQAPRGLPARDAGPGREHDRDDPGQGLRPRVLGHVGQQVGRSTTARYGIQLAQSSADADIQQQDTITVSGAITPKPDVLTTQPVVAGADKSRDIQQRVFFTAGQTIDPQPTVSMNDATLYGYQTAAASRPTSRRA